MHLFLELLTLAAFLACAAHAVRRRGAREGALLFAALLLLGVVRENAVVLREILYGFAPLRLVLGRAPLIAGVVWGYSIYAAVVWAETVTRGRASLGRPSVRLLALAALFMLALPGLYEPFLARVEMARWEPGTRATAGVPWIALVGYPSLTALFLLVWWGAARLRTAARIFALAGLVPAFAVAHALGLAALKRWLGW